MCENSRLSIPHSYCWKHLLWDTLRLQSLVLLQPYTCGSVAWNSSIQTIQLRTRYNRVGLGDSLQLSLGLQNSVAGSQNTQCVRLDIVFQWLTDDFLFNHLACSKCIIFGFHCTSQTSFITGKNSHETCEYPHYSGQSVIIYCFTLFVYIWSFLLPSGIPKSNLPGQMKSSGIRSPEVGLHAISLLWCGL